MEAIRVWRSWLGLKVATVHKQGVPVCGTTELELSLSGLDLFLTSFVKGFYGSIRGSDFNLVRFKPNFFFYFFKKYC